MAIKISGAWSSGNNDERTAERSGRSGRVIQPCVCHRSEPRWDAFAAWARLRSIHGSNDAIVSGC